MPRCVFLLGKGGVGKSTLAAVLALYRARLKNQSVRLISLDPAHNLSDIFQVPLGEKPRIIIKNLKVQQIDVQKWMHRYIKSASDKIKSTYRYLTAVNLDRHLDILQHAPGIEEYAMILAYEHTYEKYISDYLIFDLPPTGLALRFFNLPQLSLVWLRKLAELRSTIIKKRDLITQIKLGKKRIERDKISRHLQREIDRYVSLQSIFQNRKKSLLYIITNPDPLARNETEFIKIRLGKLGIQPAAVILNKVKPDHDLSDSPDHMQTGERAIFKTASQSVVGLNALDDFITQNEQILAGLD